MQNLGKDIENRDWSTKIRGSICLHASKGMKDDEFANTYDFFVSTAEKLGLAKPSKGLVYEQCDHNRRGGIVATAEIVDCVTASESPWFFGDYGFVLANFQPVDLIPVRGKLGFFDWRKRLIGGAA